MVMQMEMGSSSFEQENKIEFMRYNDHHEEDDSISSDVSSLVSSDDESDDVFEESDSSSGSPRTNEHALGNMSDLLQQLPSKKGLSKHFQGKSQSFTSLSKVICVEDLAKPENPYNKKLKACKSYAQLSRMLPPPTRSASSSRLFSKKQSSRPSCSSLSSKPPTHSNGATNALFV